MSRARARDGAPARGRAQRRARLASQLALVGGLGLGFVVTGVNPPPAAADGECPEEDLCSFRKPVFLLIMDYSTSMNIAFEGGGTTRWEAAKASVQNLMVADNDFVSRNMLVGLMRFGHDPEPGVDGTTIEGDSSGVVDGQAVDVYWYDAEQGYEYKPCNGPEIVDALEATPAPLNGQQGGIGTWTNGALLRARGMMEESLQAHPEDAPGQEGRAYLQLVMTDGEWTNPEGFDQLPEHDPSPTAAAMFDEGIGDPQDPTHVSTYVVYFGDLMGAGEADADALALAGGTDEALIAEDPMALTSALQTVVQEIKDAVITPNCVGGLPRIMVLVDGSSSMLNGGINEYPAPKGMSGWDQARFALAGDPLGENLSLFEQEITDGQQQVVGALEDFVHLGLAVFGNEAPDAEERVLVQYGACRQDNFYWALSPEVSHPSCPEIDYTPLMNNPATPMRQIIGGSPCDLPWSGAPILWDYPAVIDGQPGPESDPPGPGFDDDTYAHMPRCDPGFDVPDNICTGSGTFTHRGLQEIRANQQAYHAQAVSLEQADESTRYINILITDGQYAGYSTDWQVEGQLAAMLNEGIVTYVIGFGGGLESFEAQQQLQNMATWGGTETPYSANSQEDLEAALEEIVTNVDFDPCCQFNDCSANPEPTGGEIDPEAPCVGDDDCAPLEVCDAPQPGAPGMCAPAPCQQDGDCPQLNPPAVCTDEGECAPGPCEGDSQCPGTLVCEDGKCVGSGVCELDSDCSVLEACVDGSCVPRPCAGDEDCPESQVCDDAAGVCVPDDSYSGSYSYGSYGETGNNSYGSYGSYGESDDPYYTYGGSYGGTDSGTIGLEEDFGCGCSSGQDRAPRGLWWSALALLGLARARRRRRA